MRNLILSLVALMLLFGCIGEWRTVAEPQERETAPESRLGTGKPSSIGYLYVNREYAYLGEEDRYDVSFTLEDNSGKVVKAAGSGKLTIVDTNENVLYEKQFSALESDFEEQAGHPFYNNPVFTIEVPFSEINMSETSYADFTVEFSTGGKTLSETKNVYLSYTLVGKEEQEDEGEKSLNVSSTENDIEVRLVKGELSTYGSYKLGIEVKNLASTKREMELTEAVLVTNEKQYEISSYYSADLGNIYPGVSVSKDLWFYNVKEVGDTATLHLAIKTDDGVTGKTTQFQIDFKP